MVPVWEQSVAQTLNLCFPLLLMGLAVEIIAHAGWIIPANWFKNEKRTCWPNKLIIIPLGSILPEARVFVGWVWQELFANTGIRDGTWWTAWREPSYGLWDYYKQRMVSSRRPWLVKISIAHWASEHRSALWNIDAKINSTLACGVHGTVGTGDFSYVDDILARWRLLPKEDRFLLWAVIQTQLNALNGLYIVIICCIFFWLSFALNSNSLHNIYWDQFNWVGDCRLFHLSIKLFRGAFWSLQLSCWLNHLAL